MGKYGNGDFIVTKVYYDDPREDCSGYYQDDICFPTLEEAVKAFYDWRENTEANEPVGYYTNFKIPREIRIQHDDLVWECRSLNGKYRKRFNWLDEAKTFRDKENALALKLYRIDCTPELRAQIIGDFRYKIYAL